MSESKIFFELLKEKKYTKIENILEENPDIDLNINDEHGNYFIEYVIESDNHEFLKKVLEKEVYLDLIDNNGTTLLYNQIKYNKLKTLELLLKNSSNQIGINLVDNKDTRGRTPLHYSIIFNNFEALKILIKNNADPYIINNLGENALFYCLKYQRTNILLFLIDKFPNVNIKNYNGENLLQASIIYNNDEVINYILDNTNINLNNRTLEYGITALHQLIVFGKINQTKKLIDMGADITITDYLGNNLIHFSLSENNIQFAEYLIGKNLINLNYTNVDGNTPLHIYLSSEAKKLDNNFLEKLIENTNLNIQNNKGKTPLYLLQKRDIIGDYKSLLINKNLNIFIKDNKGKYIYQVIKNNNEILDIIYKSYLNSLGTNDLIVDWEIKCRDIINNVTEEKNFNDKSVNKIKTVYDCINKIKDVIKNEKRSIPKMKNIDYDFDSGLILKDCFFSGFPIDTLFGLLWLKKTYPFISLILDYPLTENDSIINFYSKIGKDLNFKLDFINSMILWSYQTIFFPDYFNSVIEKELKNDSTIIIIPIGIETPQGAHTNILFWDVKKKILERFEPNGKNQPLNFNYNSNLLDNIILSKFKEFDEKIKYLTPNDYLPNVGFIMIENLEKNKCSKIGDPNGFCTAWCIWYCYQKLLNYPKNNMGNLEFVEMLINNIKLEAKSFKNLIRNFSKNISEYRDLYLKKVNLDINDWVLTNYSSEKLEELEKLIIKLL